MKNSGYWGSAALLDHLRRLCVHKKPPTLHQVLLMIQAKLKDKSGVDIAFRPTKVRLVGKGYPADTGDYDAHRITVMVGPNGIVQDVTIG